MFKNFQSLILILFSSSLYASQGWRHQVVLTNFSQYPVRVISYILDNNQEPDPHYLITPFFLKPSDTKLIPVALEYTVKFEICASDTEEDRKQRLMNRMEGEKLLQQANELQGHSYARGGMFVIGAFYPDYRMQNHDSQLGQGYLESREAEQKRLRGNALIAASNQTQKCTYYFDQRKVAYNDFGIRITIKDSNEDQSGGIYLHSQVCRELKNLDTKNLSKYLSLISQDKFVPPPASIALNYVGKKIAFKTHQGKFLTSYKGLLWFYLKVSEHKKSWEKFTVIEADHHDQSVFLKDHHGRHLSATKDSGPCLSPHQDHWEKFQFIQHPESEKVEIVSVAHGTRLQVTNSGEVNLTLDRNHSEHFQICE